MPLTPEARRALEWSASMALYEAHGLLVRRGPDADEPWHVRVVTQCGSLLLYRFWREILSQVDVQIRVTGVFCHQTPKAHFSIQGASVSPELGDLLIVHEHVHPVPRRRALLVQAKMVVSGKPTQATNPEQTHLYERWPDFELHGHGARGARSRFLLGKRNLRLNARGCTYALIEKERLPLGIHGHLLPPVWRFVRAGVKEPGLNAAMILANMVLGRSSAARPAQPLSRAQYEDRNRRGSLVRDSSQGLHWSATVQELLEVTAARALTTRTTGPIAAERGVRFGFVQHGTLPRSGGAGDLFGGTDVTGPIAEFEDAPGEGISILLLETCGTGLKPKSSD